MAVVSQAQTLAGRVLPGSAAAACTGAAATSVASVTSRLTGASNFIR